MATFSESVNTGSKTVAITTTLFGVLLPFIGVVAFGQNSNVLVRGVAVTCASLIPLAFWVIISTHQALRGGRLTKYLVAMVGSCLAVAYVLTLLVSVSSTSAFGITHLTKIDWWIVAAAGVLDLKLILINQPVWQHAWRLFGYRFLFFLTAVTTVEYVYQDTHVLADLIILLLPLRFITDYSESQRLEIGKMSAVLKYTLVVSVFLIIIRRLIWPS